MQNHAGARTPRRTRSRHSLTTVVVALGVLACGACGSSQDDSPASAPQEAEAIASSDGDGVSRESETDFSLPAADYAGDPEQLAVDAFANINTWINSGYSAEAVQDPAQFEDTTPREYAAGLAAPLDEAFQDQALIESWESTPNLTAFVDLYVDTHADNLAVALSTAPIADGGSRPENEEPYRRTLEVSGIEVLSVDDDEVTVAADWESDDNREKNVGAEFLTELDDSGTLTATFVVEAGTVRIADLDLTTVVE